jgi:biopolymer transport protein ExbD
MHGPSQSKGAEPNLVPLLDLVLQLIMFFMITVNFVQADQFDESIHLPEAQNAVPLDQTAEDWVFLNLGSDGRLRGMGQQDLDNPQKVKAYLQRERDALERANKDKGKTGDLKVVVVLRADKNARYKDVWEVLQSCTEAGYRRWQLRVMTKPNAGKA